MARKYITLADDVVDNLSSTDTSVPLSANQGRVLNETKVASGNITNARIVKCTLAEYNALTTKDANTLYHITDDVSGGASYTKAESDAKYVENTVRDITGTITRNGTYSGYPFKAVRWGKLVDVTGLLQHVPTTIGPDTSYVLLEGLPVPAVGYPSFLIGTSNVNAAQFFIRINPDGKAYFSSADGKTYNASTDFWVFTGFSYICV